MFSHAGTARSDRQNRHLAGYLAFVGGYANSAGFVLIGTFTSHVTGNVGRMANDTVVGRTGAALSALSLVVAFFLGAFSVSVILESRWFGHMSRAYAVALVLEAALLSSFVGFSHLAASAHPRVLDAQAALLCGAMGIQNGLVTRLSGAVVRTTHLTGVVTDLGVEGARWFRYWRKSVADVSRLPLVFGANQAQRPEVPKIQLLGTIAAFFLTGAFAGAFAAMSMGGGAMLVAVIAVALFAYYAFHNGRQHSADASRASRR